MSDQPNDPAPRAGGLPPWLEDAERVDLALYAAIARTPTPALDRAMSRVSRAADYSKISIAAAGLLAAAGGGSGRRAAAALFNLVVKPLSRRSRPDRIAGEVPIARHVRMPASTSFPSGHTATAFAFAAGVGRVLPQAAVPLHAVAAIVGYSRVHTGVHYPGDVVAGAVSGTIVAQLVTHAIDRRAASRNRR